MMKLGLFLFLQLKDGTLTSRMPAPCWTSQALCVWPPSTRRGRSHHSSCGGSEGSERSLGPGDTHTPSSLFPQACSDAIKSKPRLSGRIYLSIPDCMVLIKFSFL